MKNIKLKILTPERELLDTEAKRVIIPTQSGEITVLPNHIPLVTILKDGIIVVKQQGAKDVIMSVSGGFVEISQKGVVILADTAERADELDEQRIEEAKKQAKETLKNLKSTDKLRFANISAKLAKQLARERALRRHRRN